MKKRIPFHICFNQVGQRMEIYSLLCENFYRVAGYSADGSELFDGINPSYIIDYWEVDIAVRKFTGKSIRNAYKIDKKAVRTLQECQTVANLESPIHPVKRDFKPLSEKQLDNALSKLVLTIENSENFSQQKTASVF